MTEYKINPVVEQMILTKLAMWTSSSYGDDLYYFFEGFNLLRREMGEDLLKEKYEKDYEKINGILINLSMLLNEIKINYDDLKSGKMNDKSKKQEFIKSMKQLPLVQNLLYDVFILYLKNSNLRNRVLTHQSIQQARYGLQHKEDKYSKDDDGDGVVI